MSKTVSTNFFTNELQKYYLGKGKPLSETTIRILNKSPFDLSEEEKEIYQTTIMPVKEMIKEGLTKDFEQSGGNNEEWVAHLPQFSQTVIGMIAAEMLSERISHKAYSHEKELDFKQAEETQKDTGKFSRKKLVIIWAICFSIAAIFAVVLGITFGKGTKSTAKKPENTSSTINNETQNESSSPSNSTTSSGSSSTSPSTTTTTPAKPQRDTSTPDKALLGHWRYEYDTELGEGGGQPVHFIYDYYFSPTVYINGETRNNGSPYYQYYDYKLNVSYPGDRFLSIKYISTTAVRGDGTSMVFNFASDYRTVKVKTLYSDSSSSSEYTWTYVDSKQSP